MIHNLKPCPFCGGAATFDACRDDENSENWNGSESERYEDCAATG
jgi:hypothetical protein